MSTGHVTPVGVPLVDDPHFTYPITGFATPAVTKHLRVWEATGGATIAVVTDTGTRDHREPSITETAGDAHAGVWARLSAGSPLDPDPGPDGLTVVEHYPDDPGYPGTPGTVGERFARITLSPRGVPGWVFEPRELLLLSLGIDTYPVS